MNGIYVHDFFADDFSDSFPSIDLSDGGGLNVRAGYRVTSWFAAEFLYQWATGLDADFGGISIPPPIDIDIDGGEVWQFDTHSLMANFKFLLPFWRFQPYIGLGLGTQRGSMDFKGWVDDVFGIDDESNWGFLGRPAFGIDWIVADHWVLNFELAGELALHNIAKELSSTDFFGLSVGGGIQYRF